jgi:peptidoglycan/xylan/chitin deacetylase (PgdA/CDA1 family)
LKPRRLLIVALPAAALAVAGCGGHGSAARKHARIPPPYQPPIGSVIGCASHRTQVYTESIATRHKVVALTFDDGPSDLTPAFLRVLERKHVHATFFVIGNQVNQFPQLVRRALRDGDMIGNHTFTHPDMTQIPYREDVRQLQKTIFAIHQATGFTPCLWRAPYGSINAGLEALARSMGMISIQWDTDPQDFTVPPTSSIVNRVLKGNPYNPDTGVHPGSIVLMHDGGGWRGHTLAALRQIIDRLRARGYRFVTVAQLLRVPLVRRAN